MDAPAGEAADPPMLSIVVNCFNMRREIARTLHSLSRAYQRDIDGLDYEVILIDNGSADPPCPEDFAGLDLDLRVVAYPDPRPSPVPALNFGLGLARAPLVGVIIDGARMASPGLLAACTRASRLHHRPIVFTQSLSLGPAGEQHVTVHQGYDQAAEDRLLESIEWPSDGYRLFEISSGLGPGPSERRWADPLFESNALFMPADLWRETGGYEPLFESPGGGCASGDLCQRACDLPDTQLIVITGEATFHQVHTDSVSTAAKDAAHKLKTFSREYHRIRKSQLRRISAPFWTFGVARSPPNPPPSHDLRDRYVELLKQVLLNHHELELEAHWLTISEILKETPQSATADLPPDRLRRSIRKLAGARAVGVNLSTYPSGYTMIGQKRLEALQQKLDLLLDQGIAGDLMECGVWRGGACILMAGMLRARGVTDRTVWVADSFAGLPKPTADDQGLDLSSDLYPGLSVDLEQVKRNFAAFDLLDDRVKFLQGWFSDTLPEAPVDKLALLRLDADLYSSTMDILQNLYPKVASGGFIIIDDYANIPPCKRAVDEFRAANGISEPLQKTDWTEFYWRKA